MNCCDHDCNQGRDCPVRATPVKMPEPTRCEAMGLCMHPIKSCPNACIGPDAALPPDTSPYVETVNDMAAWLVISVLVAVCMVIAGVSAGFVWARWMA